MSRHREDRWRRFLYHFGTELRGENLSGIERNRQGSHDGAILKERRGIDGMGAEGIDVVGDALEIMVSIGLAVLESRERQAATVGLQPETHQALLESASQEKTGGPLASVVGILLGEGAGDQMEADGEVGVLGIASGGSPGHREELHEEGRRGEGAHLCHAVDIGIPEANERERRFGGKRGRVAGFGVMDKEVIALAADAGHTGLYCVKNAEYHLRLNLLARRWENSSRFLLTMAPRASWTFGSSPMN